MYDEKSLSRPQSFRLERDVPRLVHLQLDRLGRRPLLVVPLLRLHHDHLCQAAVVRGLDKQAEKVRIDLRRSIVSIVQILV